MVNKESHKFPETTRESVRFIDSTPDEGYPLRILRAYRENCDVKWVAEPPNPLIDVMNEACDQRAEILDRAIVKLEADDGP